MKKIYYLIFLVFSSCAVRSVYVPTSQNVLLFDDKKQIQANGYIGDNHLELQVASNPINHFAVGTNTYLGTGVSIYEGYLSMYNYSKTNARWRYEILGGVGYTNNSRLQDNVWFSGFQQTKLNYETIALYNKYFIQPAVGYYSKINIYKLSYSFSISNRISYIYFNKYIYHELNQTQTLTQNTPVYYINKEYYNKGLYLFEPCITNKVGIKNCYVVIQGQFMIPSSKEIDVSNTKFSDVFIVSLGLQYNFITKKQKS